MSLDFALSNSTVVNCTLGDVDFVVVGSIRIERSMSSNAGGVKINNANYTGYVNLTISESKFPSFSVADSSCLAQWNITVVNSAFTGGGLTSFVGFTVCADILYGMHMVNTNVGASLFGISLDLSADKGNVIVSVLSSNFFENAGTAMKCVLTGGSYVSILISDTEFIYNIGFAGPASDFVPVMDLSSNAHATMITLNNVNFTNNTLYASKGTLSIIPTSYIKVNMTNVNFMGNEYFKEKTFDKTAAVYIKTIGSGNTLIFNYCKFINNTFSQGARALYIDEYTADPDKVPQNEITVGNCSIFNNTVYDGAVIIYISGQSDCNIDISNTVFDHNRVDDYIINADVNSVKVNISASSFISNIVKYGCMSVPKESLVFLISSQFINNIGICVSLTQVKIVVVVSNFTGNIGSCIYLSECTLELVESTLFYNNTAEKGAALYINQGTTVSISDDVQFLNNAASLGGAIFVDLSVVCLQKVFNLTSDVTFKDNVATTGYNGDSLYFSVSKNCKINTNASDPTSLMYIPYRFNYSELNSTNCCTVSCSNQRYTKFPVITSPHHLILCGNNIKQLNNVTYFIDNTVLGKPAIFKGGIMDYFKKPSQPVLFNLNCTTCPSDIKLSSSNHILVVNTYPLNLMFSGNERNFSINVTITFNSFVDANIQPIEAILIVQITPCFNYIGYAYSKEENGCNCYHRGHSVVKCSDYYNEIEDGYWIGVIASQPTTSLCPAHYCSFIHRNKFTLGYSELPDKVNAQCNHHRMGRACGECSPGYTLAYDTTDCISVNHCSTILTLIVVASTCAYWLIIVVGVFALLYFNKQISLGCTYGIIYYYSMVGILFSNNPYVSESAFLVVSVMSSFTQLSPQFLGKLCLVKGLSGIDQLFIHYSHAVAVSLLVVILVIAAKFSGKLSTFVSRCRIVRVICLLLLLSYTSIASTSLQLLRPLTFTDIEEVYTYSSPSIRYFHDQHALYGIMAIVCELVLGISLPLLLLLEPFASKKINFVKIKPLLDEFQNCYKDKKKYRWFASYYLICRQIILLIVFVGNSNYNRMLFFLQITCIAIAAVHMWIRPYKSASLNIFDGMILLIMAVSIYINIISFLQLAATELVLILVIFPLFVICIVSIRQLVKRLHGAEYVDNEEDMTRFVYSYTV